LHFRLNLLQIAPAIMLSHLSKLGHRGFSSASFPSSSSSLASSPSHQASHVLASKSSDENLATSAAEPVCFDDDHDLGMQVADDFKSDTFKLPSESAAEIPAATVSSSNTASSGSVTVDSKLHGHWFKCKPQRLDIFVCVGRPSATLPSIHFHQLDRHLITAQSNPDILSRSPAWP
jgi:hypothetical protein